MLSLITKCLERNEISKYKVIGASLRDRTLYRVDIYSDTAIEEHHHVKVFCYMILVYNGRNCKFVGNFRSS